MSTAQNRVHLHRAPPPHTPGASTLHCAWTAPHACGRVPRSCTPVQHRCHTPPTRHCSTSCTAPHPDPARRDAALLLLRDETPGPTRPPPPLTPTSSWGCRSSSHGAVRTRPATPRASSPHDRTASHAAAICSHTTASHGTRWRGGVEWVQKGDIQGRVACAGRDKTGQDGTRRDKTGQDGTRRDMPIVGRGASVRTCST
jgi:hypothetical protein